MIAELLFSNPAMGIVLILAIAMAISIHEAAHATVAQRLGDSTAAALGRTSLNPLVHLDPIGTILILFAGFGWGKPVPVNDSRLRRHSDIILVALAGPAANLALAVVLGVIMRMINAPVIEQVLALFIWLNLALMVFNLIPIPPLDGSKVLRLFVRPATFQILETYGIFIIIALFLVFQTGAFGLAGILSTIVSRLFGLISGAALPV